MRLLYRCCTHAASLLKFAEPIRQQMSLFVSVNSSGLALKHRDSRVAGFMLLAEETFGSMSLQTHCQSPVTYSMLLKRHYLYAPHAQNPSTDMITCVTTKHNSLMALRNCFRACHATWVARPAHTSVDTMISLCISNCHSYPKDYEIGSWPWK